MSWNDLYVDEDCVYRRTLPQLPDGPVGEVTISRWMAEYDEAVDRAAEQVEALGVDATLAALERLGVLRQRRLWDDEL